MRWRWPHMYDVLTLHGCHPTPLRRDVVLCSPALYAMLEKAGAVEDDVALLRAKAAALVRRVPMSRLTADETQVLRHAVALERSGGGQRPPR